MTDEVKPDRNKKCGECQYNDNGFCVVVIWQNGQKRRIGPVQDTQKACDLWEKKDER